MSAWNAEQQKFRWFSKGTRGEVMSFDTVLNNRNQAVFEGTTDETEAWLRKNLEEYEKDQGHEPQVCIGKPLAFVTATEYLERCNKTKVLELVREAIEVGDPNAHACIIVSKIMDLF
jgi:hypothetical protein